MAQLYTYVNIISKFSVGLERVFYRKRDYRAKNIRANHCLQTLIYWNGPILACMHFHRYSFTLTRIKIIKKESSWKKFILKLSVFIYFIVNIYSPVN